MASERVERKLAAILVADVAGYSRLAGADEERTLARLRALRSDLIDPVISVHHGRIVKRTGDGSLVEFRSVVDAVRCAIEVQAGMEERNAGLSDERRIEFRVGIHLGDVVEETDGDLMGDGVNIAARLEGIAEPGGICLSEDAWRQVRDKITVTCIDLGEQSLKNIARPMRAYRIETGQPARAQPEPEAPALPDKPSIAVLPFQNMSGDQEQEFFADGVTEDIITDLSKVSGVFVIGRQSSFVYKGKSVGLRQIGRELGVRYLLEGSVRKVGNRVRITAQLIDGGTDNHLWAERYDRNLDDIFALQSDVARAVVAALAVTLRPEEGSRIGRVPTKNLEAYDLFVRGRTALHPPTQENLDRGRKLFERTITLDPAFGGGHAGLSMVDSLSVLHGHVPRSPDVIAKATQTAEKAIALDPTLGWSYSALSWAKWIGGRHDDAIAAARKAVSLEPGNSDWLGYLGVYLTFGGRPSEAISHLEHAIRIDPRNQGPNQHFLGYANAMAGMSRTAIEILDRLPPSTYSQVTYSMLILAHGESGGPQMAMEAADAALERYPTMKTGICAALGIKNPEDLARVVAALRAAGIPD